MRLQSLIMDANESQVHYGPAMHRSMNQFRRVNSHDPEAIAALRYTQHRRQALLSKALKCGALKYEH
jgi:hypothetical protein